MIVPTSCEIIEAERTPEEHGKYDASSFGISADDEPGKESNNLGTIRSLSESVEFGSS